MLMVLIVINGQAQDIEAYKRHVTILASQEMEGRGYTGDGVRKAEQYLVEQYRAIGVDDILLQPFTIDINTFPGKATMKVDGRRLRAGEDFVMREFSPGVKGHYKLVYIDTLGYDSATVVSELSKPKYKGYFGVLDFMRGRYLVKEFRETGLWQKLPLAGMIYTWPDPLRFYKAYGEKVVEKPIVWCGNALPDNAKTIDIDVESLFRPQYQCNNVIARIKGKRSDSTLVLVAHYDHLGHFGEEVWFPGVNDNASGTATLLTLAQHFVKHRPQYDVIIISVAGEETGLRGSEYYVQHPIYPLNNIKYLINIDMIGDNSPIQYVEVSPTGLQGFEMMKAMNDTSHYFKGFEQGELASNSDHYPFAVAGVPCLMFEQEDGDNFNNYHTAKDTLDNAKYETYPAIFRLIVDFFEKQ